MKSFRNNAYSRLDDELYVSEELEELLYERWIAKMRAEEEERAKLRRALWDLFFVGGVCHIHDREGCPECRVYGLGICPSAKEEGLPHDF